MASLNDIEIKPELRPCLVKGEKALFHHWVHIHDICKNEYEVGIVEYENGEVEEVTPNNIKFCDNKITQYSFEAE